jgi:hypothetical protein
MRGRLMKRLRLLIRPGEAPSTLSTLVVPGLGTLVPEFGTLVPELGTLVLLVPGLPVHV